jgi:hypothetical protein
MALFSDVDWVILLAVAAFLLFGKDNTQVLRTLGRWYGRAGRLKQELLAEFSRAADLPQVGPGQPLSIRGALLGLDPPAPVNRRVPTAVRRAAPAPAAPIVATSHPYTGGYPTPIWSTTQAPGAWEREVLP